MKAIAKFEKVSVKQLEKDLIRLNKKVNINDIYNNLELPKRATKGSAGYDFMLPYDILLQPNQTVLIPTGIRVNINEGWLLKIYPRSSLGFKYRLQLNNSVGIIDSDYYYSDNQGHIMIKLYNGSNENKTIELKANTSFCQGIFIEYGITVDDECNEIRNGGFGSTNKGE